VRSLEVVGRDKERNLLLVKGPVPGANQGLLVIREAVRLYKRKAKPAKAAS
jgi:large subunit ribosomal protein L3